MTSTAMICDMCSRPADVRIAYGTEKGIRLRGRPVMTWLCLKHSMELWNRCKAVVVSGAMTWENHEI
jgi:hypothetical protein